MSGRSRRFCISNQLPGWFCQVTICLHTEGPGEHLWKCILRVWSQGQGTGNKGEGTVGVALLRLKAHILVRSWQTLALWSKEPVSWEGWHQHPREAHQWPTSSRPSLTERRCRIRFGLQLSCGGRVGAGSNLDDQRPGGVTSLFRKGKSNCHNGKQGRETTLGPKGFW